MPLCRGFISPHPRPHGPSQQGSPQEGMAGPALQAGCCAALCSSHPPSLMDLAGMRARVVFFTETKLQEIIFTNARKKSRIYLGAPSGPARAVPEAGGGGAVGRTPARRWLPWERGATQHLGAFSQRPGLGGDANN